MIPINLKNKSYQFIQKLYLQKVYSLIQDFANLDEYGIKEKEFSKLFKISLINTFDQIFKFLYLEILEILTLRR